MRLGWRQFGRDPRVASDSTPDAAVTPPRKWQMVAVIVASTAALLGTSQEGPTYSDSLPGGSFTTTYSFERKGIQGGSVDLTSEQPRATFYVNMRANALGADDVITTQGASVALDANVKSSGFAAGTPAPYAAFKLTSPANPVAVAIQTLDHYTESAALTFNGNCSAPAEGDACSTHFALEIARADDGKAPGTVHVEWTFQVSASGTQPNSSADTTVGPDDVPWTIEIMR